MSLTLRDNADSSTIFHAVAVQNGEERAFAVTRCDADWNGGRTGWLRGSLPFQPAGVTHLPRGRMGRFFRIITIYAAAIWLSSVTKKAIIRVAISAYICLTS
ncbi:hypothetical protein [Paenibacillus allorhizoplanae]|uniref:hypothetical protein n=1 Tax=Paenibacillus allorhizoplanae TaxID=2905648 RepID=UPI001F17246E|nr:hypothetical protein [Paenibacillus allorhizoplanae]